MKRGVIMGTLLAAWRILRCNPMCDGGYDPVPCGYLYRNQLNLWDNCPDLQCNDLYTENQTDKA